MENLEASIIESKDTLNSSLSLGKYLGKYEVFVSDGNKLSEIPWIIKLFENPSSPLALPGAATLFQHDCMQTVYAHTFNRGKLSYDERFVMGTTMGNDPKTNLWHIFGISLCLFFRDHDFSLRQI